MLVATTVIHFQRQKNQRDTDKSQQNYKGKNETNIIIIGEQGQCIPK